MATKNITLTNLEIYTTAQALMESITTDINLPVKVGFYIQKNMKKMTEQRHIHILIYLQEQ